ncbi:CapA family protein [Paenibacillus sp. LHD-117]|uniref:CapA family protein n=1 Tax=Paenibacillus sp. LHD-117 TaxID=3071412 RepID=UPI0027DF667B|nr:CapA family protein [Paenibacillus sp. LHD-117]MDQ6421840.1 CapA family protein [Paenibacillus sp. LHD-117]
MSLSRSESRQREKLNRKQKQRRSLSLFLILIGSAIVVFGAWLMLNGGDGIGGGGGNQPSDLAANGNVGSNDHGPEQSSEAGDGNEDGEPSAPNDPTEEAGPTPTTAPVTDETGVDEGQAGEEEAVSMSFVGDMLPGEYLNPLMKQNGFDYPYRNTLLYLSEPDITAGNLELPITLGGTPIIGTPYVYKGHPEALPAIKDAGFDVLSLANNHAMDQGVEGMQDTIKHLNEAGIGFMGTGSNDKEAFKPHIVEAKGLKVAFVGISRVIPYTELKADRNTPGIAETYDTTRAVASISGAKKNADLVVVMVHWGDDGAEQPVDYQKTNARAYIDAGADLVIGAHPHVLQGFEMYKGKWIAYSLGNFIFSVYPKGTQAETGVLDAACTRQGDCKLKFNPMIVMEGQPTPLRGDKAAAMLDRLTSISHGARLDQEGYLVAE